MKNKQANEPQSDSNRQPPILQAQKKGSSGCGPKCAFFREIERLREVCLKCRVCSDSNSMQIAGRGIVGIDTAEDPESVILHSIGRKANAPEVYRNTANDNAPRSVTPLPPEIEERVRLLLAALIGLEPMKILVLHHLANGGNLSNFNEYFLALQTKWNSYQHFDKRNVWAIFNCIRRQHPELNVLFVRKLDPRNRNGKVTAE